MGEMKTNPKLEEKVGHSTILDKEIADLNYLNKQPLLKRWKGFLKFTGPASMEAATTLGAGSFASAVILGASSGYTMLWIPFYSYLLGLFMLALATRFATSSEISVIEAQNKYHSKIVGSGATGIIACFLAMVVFSFGQYALGTDTLESACKLININFPRNINWIVIMGISAGLSLIYGKSHKAVRLVENAMKIMIGIMLLTFVVVLFKTGINIKAAIRGLIIPTLPSGVAGITMGIAALSAAMGVGDWVMYHYSNKVRGYTKAHEKLSVFDSIVGGLIPVTLVLAFVTIAFAESFSGRPGIPETTSELAAALVSVLPSIWIKVGFYLGVLAITVSTMVGMSILAAQSFCYSLGLEQDVNKWYWKAALLAPQIGFLGAFIGKPLWAVIIVASLNSIFNWISGLSWYLLGNDKRYLGKETVKSYFLNFGVLLSAIVLNLAFITFILSRIGVWS